MELIGVGVADTMGSNAASLVAEGKISSSGVVGSVGETKTVVNTVIVDVDVDVVERVEKAGLVEVRVLGSGLGVAALGVEAGSTNVIAALEIAIPSVSGAAVFSGGRLA
jgi:hypothetical protein